MATIKLVDHNDIPQLLPLMRGYCDFYEVAPTDDDLIAMSSALIDDPVHEGMQFIGFDDSGQAIGFATVFWSWATTLGGRQGIMHDLFVTPEARGTGIAAALIERCTQAAAEHGGRALIWSTDLNNHRAQKLYDRTGASKYTWLEYTITLPS